MSEETYPEVSDEFLAAIQATVDAKKPVNFKLTPISEIAPTDPALRLALEIADKYGDKEDTTYAAAFCAALAGIRRASELAADLGDRCNASGPYDAIGLPTLLRQFEHLKG